MESVKKTGEVQKAPDTTPPPLLEEGCTFRLTGQKKMRWGPEKSVRKNLPTRSRKKKVLGKKEENGTMLPRKVTTFVGG